MKTRNRKNESYILILKGLRNLYSFFLSGPVEQFESVCDLRFKNWKIIFHFSKILRCIITILIENILIVLLKNSLLL